MATPFSEEWARANGVPYNDTGWLKYVGQGQSGASDADQAEARGRADAGVSTGGIWNPTTRTATGANPSYTTPTYEGPLAVTPAPGAGPAQGGAPTTAFRPPAEVANNPNLSHWTTNNGKIASYDPVTGRLTVDGIEQPAGAVVGGYTAGHAGGAYVAPAGAAPGQQTSAGQQPPGQARPGGKAYADWLSELRGYQAPTTGSVGATTSGPEQLTTMLAGTHADRYLSPYYLSYLKNTADRAGAGYNVTAALQGNSNGIPTGGAGAQSMSEYMQQALLDRNDQGLATSGWGPYQSGVNQLGNFAHLLSTSQGATGTGHDMYTHYMNTTEGRAQLESMLRAGLEGPFANSMASRLGDQFTAHRTDLTPEALYAELGPWLQEAYGIR